LHDLASSESELEKKEDIDSAEGAVQVRVIIDGPYGGWQPLGAREVEEVICFAGGSGVSYLIGVAEEAKRIFSEQEEKEGGKLRVVRLVWVTKDFGESRRPRFRDASVLRSEKLTLTYLLPLFLKLPSTLYFLSSRLFSLHRSPSPSISLSTTLELLSQLPSHLTAQFTPFDLLFLSSSRHY